MIKARHFVEAARERGFEWYAGVPCSYLTPFINYVLQDPSLHYVSMTNEGDAVALIAGIALGGARGGGKPVRYGRGVSMMQNSGLGNAVSPLTSLTWTWELFPTQPQDIGPALDRAMTHMDATGRPYALVMQKGSVAPHPLKPGAAAIRARSSRPTAVIEPRRLGPSERPSRQEALREVVARTSPAATAVLASTGFCGRELYAVSDRPNHLYMVGSMGCVVPLALGLALARPDLQVLALDGDGAWTQMTWTGLLNGSACPPRTGRGLPA